ncbi:TetR family transcriptional regulator C-terminal domain-containing protein [Sphingomonas sp. LR61]|uniref:TetR family transcriptional regulator C-terminal domain-containing protein n=1 Tax=Sphingomonas sp. LR61 TaxID=3050234 RepID=UPI003FA6A9C5
MVQHPVPALAAHRRAVRRGRIPARAHRRVRGRTRTDAAARINPRAASSDPANEGADYYRTLYLRFRQTIREALERDIHAGREPDTMDPARATEQLLALYDGLRVQALLVPGFDIIEAFDRAASRMRRGWSEDSPPHRSLRDPPRSDP